MPPDSMPLAMVKPFLIIPAWGVRAAAEPVKELVTQRISRSKHRPGMTIGIATRSTLGRTSPKLEVNGKSSKEYLMLDVEEEIKEIKAYALSGSKVNKFPSTSSIQLHLVQPASNDRLPSGQMNSSYFMRKAIEESRSEIQEDSVCAKDYLNKDERNIGSQNGDWHLMRSPLIKGDESQSKNCIKALGSGVDTTKDPMTLVDQQMEPSSFQNQSQQRSFSRKSNNSPSLSHFGVPKDGRTSIFKPSDKIEGIRLPFLKSKLCIS